MNRSPRLATRLLAWRLPAADRDEIIGDLEEQFAHVRDARGLARARRWYWRQALSLAVGRADTPEDSTPAARIRVMSMDDLRFAARRFARQPGVTIASIATLALAIGAGVAAWSLLSAVLLHPLPVEDPDRLMAVGMFGTRDNTGRLRIEHTYPLYPAMRDSGVFQSVAGGGHWDLLVASGGGLAESRPIFFATYGFFGTLGVRLPIGRVFGREDDTPGAPLVTILSDRYWRRVFEADPAIVGRTLLVSGKTATIVGVAPAGFRGTSLVEAPDLYLPFHSILDVGPAMVNYLADGTNANSPTAWVRIFARLQPGMTRAEAVQRLATVTVNGRAYGPHLALTDIDTAALPEGFRAGIGQFARLLAATVALLLLIGCLTVGMLLLLRTEARRDEFALCLALGAGRARLGAGIALDGALLAGAGALAALPVSLWLFTGVRAFQLPGGVDIELLELHLDRGALLAAVLAAVVVTFAVALLAGIFGLAANTADVLRARAGATPRVGRRWTRASLVVAGVAIALVLLTGAGLFLRSLASALSLNPGFETTRIATGGLSLRGYGYSPERGTQFLAELRDRLELNPAIRFASIFSPQGGMGGQGTVVIDGQRRSVPSFVAYTSVDDRYFHTIGLTISRGRNFTADDRAGAPPVSIVSASYAKFIASDGDALGHHITESSHPIGQPAAVFEIVGVVPDVITDVATLEPMVMYRPISQDRFANGSGMIALRSERDSKTAIGAAISAIKEMDPTIPPPTFQTMEEGISRQMGPQKLGATVLGGLGVIAAILTLFGTFVLVESMSVLRRREMGVRAALGATRRQLGGLIITETLRLIGCGLGAGLLLAWAGAETIRAFLFRVQPLDALTIGGVLVAILTLALLVALRPALRASRVDLGSVLREE